MRYRGVSNWLPTWIWIDGREDKCPKGEVGILKAVTLSDIQPSDRCYLHIYYEGSNYMGCLLFDDYVFCGQITKLLEAHCNRRIVDIGSLDLSHTL